MPCNLTLTPKDKKNAQAAECKSRLDKMIDSGDLNRMARLLTVAYETYSVADTYCQEAVDIMEKYNFVHKKIKTATNNLSQSFDVFDRVMQSFLDENADIQFCRSYETTKEILDACMENTITVKRGPYLGATLFLPTKK